MISSISNKSEFTSPDGAAAQLLEAVAFAETLSDELDRVRAERDCYSAAYLDLLARHRATITGSLPAIERARINEASALTIALAAGSRLRMVA